MGKIDKLRAMSRRLIPQEPEDLIIERTFVDVGGQRGPTLREIVRQEGMTREEIDAANIESQRLWDIAMEELS